MHELGLMQGVLESVNTAAEQAGALCVTQISISIGEMTEAVDEALVFAFEALSPETLSENAQLSITMVKPRSRCLACGHEYEHDRYHIACPVCKSLSTEILAGKDLFIDTIEVELPDEDEDRPDTEQG